MEFKNVLISELKPAKYNPRKDLQPADPEFKRIKKSIEEFGRLMDGKKADMVFTDPPYGMDAVKNSGVLKKKYSNILGDSDNKIAIKSLEIYLPLLIPQIWFGANYYTSHLPESSCWLVWDKNNGESDQMDCELAWTNLSGVTRKFTKASDKKDRVHPTQKPVGLIEWIINKFSLSPDIIIDPFLGSGTTIIACEQLNLICYGMEISPQYCEVICQRWEKLTGKKREKVIPAA